MTLPIKYSKRSAIMAMRPSILNIQTRSWFGMVYTGYTGGDSTLAAKFQLQIDIYTLRYELHKIARKFDFLHMQSEMHQLVGNEGNMNCARDRDRRIFAFTLQCCFLR